MALWIYTLCTTIKQTIRLIRLTHGWRIRCDWNIFFLSKVKIAWAYHTYIHTQARARVHTHDTVFILYFKGKSDNNKHRKTWQITGIPTKLILYEKSEFVFAILMFICEWTSFYSIAGAYPQIGTFTIALSPFLNFVFFCVHQPI